MPSAAGTSGTSGRFDRAQSTNRTVASSAGSGGTGQTCSPPTPSISRLVASTATPGQYATIAWASRAASSSTCSQLSSTSNSCRPPRYSITVCSIVSPCRSRTRSAAATEWPTGLPSASGASSHHHTPSGNRADSCRATSSASRDLPTPPVPVSVTRGVRRSAAATSATWSARPAKLVCRRGRLVAVPTGASAGSCSSNCWCASRDAADGSTPSSSDRNRRRFRYTSSASAWRPDRYRARISKTDRRSRSGNRLTRISSSMTTSPARPRPQQGLGPLLPGRQPQLLQPGHLGLYVQGGRLEVRQYGPAPQRQSGVQQVRGPVVVPGSRPLAGLGDEPLEPCGVQLVRRGREPVAGRLEPEPLGLAGATQHRPQAGDIGPQSGEGIRGRVVPPHGGDQPVDRDHGVPMQQQHGQQGTRLGAAHRDRNPAGRDLERSQDPELHRGPHSGRRLGTAATRLQPAAPRVTPRTQEAG
jgi:hypothetical protein